MSIGVSRTEPTPKHAAATNTVDVERAWLREVNGRFRRLRGLVRRTIGYRNDAANLGGGPHDGEPQRSPGTGEPEPAEAFPTLTEGMLLAAFGAWFANAARKTVLDPVPRSAVLDGQHWTAPFIETAFKRGVNQSTGLLYQAGVGVPNLPNDEILTDGGFQQAVRQRYFAPFNELEGLTDDMAAEMDRVLREGLDEGWNPRRTADAMTAALRSLERDRAYTIARTETAFSQAQASIENYRRAGVGTVGHVGRIVTPDERLCAFCRRLADETFTLAEFMGTRALFRGTRYFIGVPAHPNCRCAPIPKPGVDTDDLAPLSERVPGRVIGRGVGLYGPRTGEAFA